MSGTIVLTQTDTPTAPSAGQTALSFPATLLNQLKFVDGDGNTNILYFPAGGGTLTIPATGTVALTQSPTLITPVLGVATATTINKVTLTAPATGSTLTIADGKTLTVNENLTLAGATGKTLTLTDSLTVQGGGATILSSAGAYTLTIPESMQAAGRDVANTFTAAQTMTASAAAAAIRFNVTAEADSVLSFSAIAGSESNGWKWMQDEVATGDMYLKRREVSVDYGVMYFKRSNGHVFVGTTTDGGQMAVSQSNTAGATPVLYVEQLDISEEMFEFATTIGTGNAIEAAAAKVLTTTHFVKVTIPGGLTRYIPCGTIA